MVIMKSDWLYSLQPKMEKLYTVSKKKRDQELTVAQIMNSLLPNSDLNWRKWGETTRPFRYDLNPLQLYSGSDKQIQGTRSDRVPEELWTEVHDIVQEAVIKTIPKKKKCKKGKMVVWGGLTNSWEKKRS